MHDTLPLLQKTPFPALNRAGLETLQVNLGYRCNQQCLHCHVAASPRRTEVMTRETVDSVLGFLERSGARTLDLTGGAPELNPHFRELVSAARALGVHVMDRCNLTVLLEPGQEDSARFLARNDVEIVASLPCYLEENVDGQRGAGVYQGSIRALRLLNELGYGDERILSLVYNPTGPTLPPAQRTLEDDYRRELDERFGIRFSRLFTLANMPIARFGSTLVSKGEFDGYMKLLRDNHQPENLDGVMCRSLISVDWRGYVYDCDFNQMLGLPLGLPRDISRGIGMGGHRNAPSSAGNESPPHLDELDPSGLAGAPVAVAGHCYGCTAGQGSSCGGALGAD
ncbi:MAG: arsenosugar biosynthesis radical SAM (seleno)protein ArsS [Gammaproteobacteria bacterium]